MDAAAARQLADAIQVLAMAVAALDMILPVISLFSLRSNKLRT